MKLNGVCDGLPLEAIPAAITKSVRTVLVAHGHVERFAAVIGNDALERLLDEIGRNASQSLLNLDKNSRDSQDKDT